MQILTADEIRAWDKYTIEHEPVSSLDLMERAARTCVDWLLTHGYATAPVTIFCGKGNNGGDGLAIARLLSNSGCDVTVCILEFGHLGTDDFQANLARLHETHAAIRFISSPDHLAAIETGTIIIDALFGSGINRPLDGLSAEVVRYINHSAVEVVSIDIPSGMFADKSTSGPVVSATHTLSFQSYKPAFLVADNQPFLGTVHILDIGLHPGYSELISPAYQWIDAAMAKALYRPRPRFSHKGDFGHALLVAGSKGKTGAAILAAHGCLRTGSGLLTVYTSAAGLTPMQMSVPEAMVITDSNERWIAAPPGETARYDVIGIGPGIGTEQETRQAVLQLLESARQPLVLDADALNILATEPHGWKRIPPGSILTPHPKEFDRLFGEHADGFARLASAVHYAKEQRIHIVLKGHNTLIATEGGKAYFNSTGNPGMAKGGSGDVLTGMLTALIAQGYGPVEAAILGVYMHGRAGDLASGYHGEEAMLPTDLIHCIGEVYREFSNESAE